MLSVKCQHNLLLIHLDFFLFSCSIRKDRATGMVINTGEVMGGGSRELEQDRQSPWGWCLLREFTGDKTFGGVADPWGLCSFRGTWTGGRDGQRGTFGNPTEAKARPAPGEEQPQAAAPGTCGNQLCGEGLECWGRSVYESMGWNFRNQVSCLRLKALKSCKDSQKSCSYKSQQRTGIENECKSQRQHRK